MNKVIMITGANAGIGKDTARQLALMSQTEKIYLACRNEAKATVAKKELEAATGKFIFEIIIIDVSDLDSVRRAVISLKAPIDALIMNAGGGGGNKPDKIDKYGGTAAFAVNLLGHVVLLEELIKAEKLNNVALYVGSEAALGVPKMGMKPPDLKTSSVDEFVSVFNGKYFSNSKFDFFQNYGQIKYAGALWMGYMARKYPNLRFITMSPGGTAGTEITSSEPFPKKLILGFMMQFLMPLLGVFHKLEVGAKRFVDGITDESLKSGSFYASKANKLSGPIIDQSTLQPDLRKETHQDNANKAIHKFIA